MGKLFAGADISKRTIDIYIRLGGKDRYCQISNGLSGFEELETWFQKLALPAKPHIVCEATGKYYLAFAKYFHACGCAVSVVNPYQINKFGESNLRRTKTDKQDAKIIHDFAVSAAVNRRLFDWEPEPQENSRLRAYHRLIEQLQVALTAEKNRIQEADAEIAPFHQANITHLKQQIRQVKRAVAALLKQDSVLSRANALLQTIPGIGKATAPILLSYLLGSVRFKTANKFVAYCGLSPTQFQSGTSVNQHKKPRFGKKDLKTALYMPALKAYSLGIFNHFVAGMRNRGKKPMTIIIAIMRKLAVIAYHIIKTGKPFEAERYIKAA